MPGGRPRATRPDSVKSITKVLDILEHLGASRSAVSVSDLARATKINVSTAYRLLQTLMARGYVVQEAANRGYLLGPRIFQMGSAYLQGSDLATVARPHLEALRDAVHETTYLVIFSQGEIVQLCTADGKQAVSASFRSMVREPAYCTATGKVLLSGLSGEELDSYFDGLKPQAFTPQTVTSKPQLRKEIVKVRQVGFALDLEEFVPNLCCVSVPVMNQEGSAPVAAISMAMPRMRFKRTQVPQWCRQLREKASLITQQLAFIG
jgi:IclR family transcriptional regulator, KDG regulon repressor